MAGKGQADGCANCAKWLLIIFNVLFCLIGVALIAAGVYAYIELRDFLNIVGDPNINAPAIVIIVFGCITFVIAAIGCLGACKESPCLLFTFAVIIGLLVIAEVVAGAVAAAYRGQIVKFVNDKAPVSMTQYNETNKEHVVTVAWDKLQKKLECCGLNNSADWQTHVHIDPPMSCGDATIGCIPKIIELFEKNVAIVAGVGIGFGLIELLGIVLACCVGCNARKGETA